MFSVWLNLNFFLVDKHFTLRVRETTHIPECGITLKWVKCLFIYVLLLLLLFGAGGLVFLSLGLTVIHNLFENAPNKWFGPCSVATETRQMGDSQQKWMASYWCSVGWLAGAASHTFPTATMPSMMSSWRLWTLPRCLANEAAISELFDETNIYYKLVSSYLLMNILWSIWKQSIKVICNM